MKKTLWISILVIVSFLTPALAEDKKPDADHLQGWVQDVDYSHGTFGLLDESGHQHRVMARRGTITEYKRGDHVRVTLDPDREWMNTVEKI